MSAPQQSSTRNQLLARMAQEDYAALQPHLEPVSLELRQTLIEPDRPIEHVYFPESGYSSIVTNSHGGKIELGIIGREGWSGCRWCSGFSATRSSTSSNPPAMACAC